MSKTTAPKTPSPHKKAAKAKKAARVEISEANGKENYRKEFFVAAMNMSWQLAVVVLVPIIGGFELDQKFDTLPALTIAGFFIAMGGMGVVVWRQLQLFAPPADNGKGAKS